MPDKTVSIPAQRTNDVPEVKGKRVVTTYIATITLDEPYGRHKWRGSTDEEILASLQSGTPDEHIEEFSDELNGMAHDDPRLLFVRHVKIVDSQ